MSWSKKPEQLEGTAKPPEEKQPPKEQPKETGGNIKHSDNSGKFLINSSGLAQQKHFEGLYLKAYLDSVGVPTIAYGRIKYPDGRKVRLGDTCTEHEAEAWLLYDLYSEGAKYVRAFLNDDVENELNENQFSALVGFTFNRGAGRFRDYVAPFINKRDFKGAMDSLVKVNYAGADRRYLLGLDRRRWAERYLFEGKDWRAFDTVAKFNAFKARGYK